MMCRAVVTVGRLMNVLDQYLLTRLLAGRGVWFVIIAVFVFGILFRRNIYCLTLNLVAPSCPATLAGCGNAICNPLQDAICNPLQAAAAQKSRLQPDATYTLTF